MFKPNRGWIQRGIVFPPKHMCTYIIFNCIAFAIGAGLVIIWNLQGAKKVYAVELRAQMKREIERCGSSFNVYGNEIYTQQQSPYLSKNLIHTVLCQGHGNKV